MLTALGGQGIMLKQVLVLQKLVSTAWSNSPSRPYLAKLTDAAGRHRSSGPSTYWTARQQHECQTGMQDVQMADSPQIVSPSCCSGCQLGSVRGEQRVQLACVAAQALVFWQQGLLHPGKIVPLQARLPAVCCLQATIPHAHQPPSLLFTATYSMKARLQQNSPVPNADEC